MNAYQPSWSLTRLIVTDALNYAIASSLFSFLVIYIALFIIHEPTANTNGSALKQLDVLMILFFSPVVETLVMSLFFFFVKKLWRLSVGIYILNAAIWSILHGIIEPVWLLSSFVSFLFFGLIFDRYEKVSMTSATIAVLITHFLQNAIGISIQFLF